MTFKPTKYPCRIVRSSSKTLAYAVEVLVDGRWIVDAECIDLQNAWDYYYDQDGLEFPNSDLD